MCHYDLSIIPLAAVRFIIGRPKEREQAVSCLERTTACLRWSRVAGGRVLCMQAQTASKPFEAASCAWPDDNSNMGVAPLDSDKIWNRCVAVVDMPGPFWC